VRNLPDDFQGQYKVDQVADQLQLRDDPTGLGILAALQTKPVYYGTASRTRVAKRRAKNKVAKQSRKKNRA
jgi:hypothetical protein